MPLSTQRTVSLAILGLAIVGLGVDKFILSGSVTGPAAASADLLVVPAALSAAAAIATPPSAAPEVAREQLKMAELARSLRALGIESRALDALPESFDVAVPPHEDVDPVPVPTVAVREPPLVTAVLTGNQPRAIAGGKSVAVGGSVEGWTVVFVGQGRVVFERDGQQAERKVYRGPTVDSLKGG